MPKQYMSRNDRTQFIFLNALTAKTDEIIQDLAAHNGDKEVLKHLRTGLTWIRKGLQTWTQPIDDQNIDKLLREVSLYNVGLIFHKDSMKHVVSMEQADRDMRREAMQQLGPDAMYDLAEWTMKLACRVCSGNPRCSEQGCSIANALEALSMPHWDSDHSKCSFAGAGSTESKYEV